MIFVIKYIIYFLPTDQIGSSQKIRQFKKLGNLKKKKY